MAKKAKASATVDWRRGSQRVRDRWQIALYVPKELASPLKKEARKRRRAYSATICEILAQYFQNQKLETQIAEQLNEAPASAN